MTFDPIIAFCKQRLSDLGATQMAQSTNLNQSQMTLLAESSKRAVVELQMVIVLCEGLNRVSEYLPAK